MPVSVRTARRLAQDFNQFHHCCADEVGIYFVSKIEMTRLHGQFFQDPTPTDSLSFPIDAVAEHGYKALGDLFACPAVAQEYASKHRKDFYQELTLYVVHGLLHLIGYDDLEPRERQRMRKAERKYLVHVGAQNLWLQ
jgi:probable rRNA maturation factor